MFLMFLAMYDNLSAAVGRIYIQQCFFFFLLSQIMIIGCIIVQRIKLTAVNIVNRVVRSPGKGQQVRIYLASTLTTLAASLVLSVCLTKQMPQFLLLGAMGFMDFILYVSLLIRLSKLRTIIGGAVTNIRKKALLYGTMLFLGFLIEITCAVSMKSMQKDQVYVNCPPIMSPIFVFTWCIYSIRYIWDPASYFFCNGQPRTLLKKRFRQSVQQLNCFNRRVQPRNEVAVVPYIKSNNMVVVVPYHRRNAVVAMLGHGRHDQPRPNSR